MKQATEDKIAKAERIAEGNVLIALFDGYKLDDAFPDKGRVYRKVNSLELNTTFKYHESWDLLMPIYIKISGMVDTCAIEETICWFQIGGQYSESNSSFINSKFETSFEQEGETLLDSVWNSIVEFIEWHNKYKIK